ncbi:3-hydroxybenzoate transporter MhbT [Drosophila sulfurigaster albostrigata]|uniref:3-hydroxybenzoate transporter MhbT n=1 Tax=Drosophila sulfurigaster albostrigata TaxID=89887 RepID=UPI002D21BE52|nr:3-hydroxybenzoate transporter MhbT [Drosophila sulfurigaster albostrigata]
MDNSGYVIDCEHEFGNGNGNAEKCQTKPAQKEYSFEEAITLTGVGRFHLKLLLICGLCFMAVMVEIMGVSLIMPLVKCDLQSTLEQQGLLASAGFLGVVLSSHAMGFLADTWGRVATLRYAMMFSAISSIVSAFSVNIWMLIVCRFLTGFFISGGQACVFSLCGEFHGSKSRVRHVTLLSCFMCIAMMFAPAVAIGILPLQLDFSLFGMAFGSWRVFLIADVSITLLALCGLHLLPETPKYQLVQGHLAEALQTMRYIYAQNSGQSEADFPVERLAQQSGGASLSSVHGFWDAVRLIWHQTVPLFYRSRIAHTLNICLMQFLIYGVAQGIFMWFPTILNELGKETSEGSLLCTVLQSFSTAPDAPVDGVCIVNPDINTYQVMITIGAAFTVIYLIFAYTIDYIGKRNLIIIWMILTMICLILLHFITQSVLVIIGLTFIMAIGNCGGLVSTIAMEFYPTQINAMGMCFIMMIGRLGAVVGSNVIGRLLFSLCDITFWTLLGLVSLLSCMSYFLPDQSQLKIRFRISSK